MNMTKEEFKSRIEDLVEEYFEDNDESISEYCEFLYPDGTSISLSYDFSKNQKMNNCFIRNGFLAGILIGIGCIANVVSNNAILGSFFVQFSIAQYLHIAIGTMHWCIWLYK